MSISDELNPAGGVPCSIIRTLVLDRMKALGMSQRELAALLGYSEPAVSMMLSEDFNPQFKTLRRVLAALGGEVRVLWKE